MNFARFLPYWNSLDSVRLIHSHLELAAIVLFILLALFDVLAHLAKDRPRATLLERIGLCCFVLAVLSEFLAYPYGQRNDTLSGQIIGSLDQKARDASANAQSALDISSTAKIRAGDAEMSAESAYGAAGRAKTAADRAAGVAQDAQTLAVEDEKKAERLALNLQMTGPRSWLINGKNQNDFVEALKPFAGQKIEVTYCSWEIPSAPFGTDREVSSLVLTLNGLIQFNAHWDGQGMDGSRDACAGSGVWVNIDPHAPLETNRAGKALVDQLAKLGLSGKSVVYKQNTRFPPDTIMLFVQPHP